jgi:phosphomevalonate kinase
MHEQSYSIIEVPGILSYNSIMKKIKTCSRVRLKSNPEMVGEVTFLIQDQASVCFDEPNANLKQLGSAIFNVAKTFKVSELELVGE